MINIVKTPQKRVLTYGTFDLFHYGHLQILKRAASLGNHLVVGVSTDEFNRIKKKDCYYPFQHRAAIVRAISYVSEVIPEKNWHQKKQDIQDLNIDILVMGDDWKGHFDELEKYCEVIYLPRTKDISTKKIKQDLSVL